MAQFDIKLKYKIEKINAKADALSRLNTMSKTITHDDNDDIQVFEPELVNVELEPNKSPNEFGFIDV